MLTMSPRGRWLIVSRRSRRAPSTCASVMNVRRRSWPRRSRSFSSSRSSCSCFGVSCAVRIVMLRVGTTRSADAGFVVIDDEVSNGDDASEGEGEGSIGWRAQEVADADRGDVEKSGLSVVAEFVAYEFAGRLDDEHDRVGEPPPPDNRQAAERGIVQGTAVVVHPRGHL